VVGGSRGQQGVNSAALLPFGFDIWAIRAVRGGASLPGDSFWGCGHWGVDDGQRLRCGRKVGLKDDWLVCGGYDLGVCRSGRGSLNNDRLDGWSKALLHLIHSLPLPTQLVQVNGGLALDVEAGRRACDDEFLMRRNSGAVLRGTDPWRACAEVIVPRFAEAAASLAALDRAAAVLLALGPPDVAF